MYVFKFVMCEEGECLEDAFDRGIKELMECSHSIEQSIHSHIGTAGDNDNDSEAGIVGRLAAQVLACWHGETRAPFINIVPGEIKYTTSGGLTYGWNRAGDISSDFGYRFIVQHPDPAKTIAESTLYQALCAAGYIMAEY